MVINHLLNGMILQAMSPSLKNHAFQKGLKMKGTWWGFIIPYNIITIPFISGLLPLKTNMSPENQGLEDVFPIETVPFLKGHVRFSRVSFLGVLGGIGAIVGPLRFFINSQQEMRIRLGFFRLCRCFLKGFFPTRFFQKLASWWFEPTHSPSHFIKTYVL